LYKQLVPKLRQGNTTIRFVISLKRANHNFLLRLLVKSLGFSHFSNAYHLMYTINLLNTNIINPLDLGLPSSYFPSACSGRFGYRVATFCSHFTVWFVTRMSIKLLSTIKPTCSRLNERVQVNLKKLLYSSSNGRNIAQM